MSLEDALQFVRNTDNPVWNRLIAEMNATRKRRDEEAVKQFRVGDLVRFETQSNHTGQGPIVKLGRAHVVMEVASEKKGLLQHIRVPASMVSKCG